VATEAGKPGWRAVLAPRWLAWHAFVVVAVAGMALLGDWQFRRAQAGNALSWAYTFEWPVFAVFAIVFWVKTIRDELRPGAGQPAAAEPELPDGIGAPRSSAAAGAPADEEPDPELDAYNEYLARLSSQGRGHGRWHGFR
jgi:hypothetical protein